MRLFWHGSDNKKGPKAVYQIVCETKMADPTRLELATSAVTGQRSNQLSYES